MLVPKPRGALSEALFEQLRRWPDQTLVGPRAPGPRRGRRHRALDRCTSCPTAGSTTSRTSWSGSPACWRCAAGSSATLEDRLRARYRPPETDRAVRRGALRLHRRSRRRSPWPRHVQRHGHRGPGARPAPAALDLPPQGGRPDRLGRAPASRRRRRRRWWSCMYDEYGAGDPNRLHAHLFARGMEAAGLRAEYGAYVDEAPARDPRAEQRDVAVRPAPALARRGTRPPGGVRGHQLAALAPDGAGARAARLRAGARGATTPSTSRRTPCTSSSPSGRICGALVEAEPTLADDVFFGAFTCLDLEDRVADAAAHASGRRS